MSLSCSSVCITLSGLKSQYGEPLGVEVGDCGCDLHDVGDGLVGRKRAVARLADLLERRAAHVLHDDVADRGGGSRINVFDEVVDPDDVRVLYLGEGEHLGRGGGHRRPRRWS